MPRKSRAGSSYPSNWREIANAVKAAANWTCVRCGHAHDPTSGHTLTIHHADMDPSNSRFWNLLPLCQRCHLSIQARVVLDRPWVLAEHTAWAKPYMAGFYAWKYLGLDLTRAEVEARLDELLALERHALLGR